MGKGVEEDKHKEAETISVKGGERRGDESEKGRELIGLKAEREERGKEGEQKGRRAEREKSEKGGERKGRRVGREESG